VKKVSLPKFLVFCVSILLVLSGCGRTDSPERLAEQAKALGVYVLAPDALREVGVFGVEDHDIFAETMTFKFTEAVPKVKDARYFVVNMPNANITDSKVFWLTDFKNSKWHYSNPNDEQDPKPMKSSTEPLTNGLYKVSPADVPAGQPGFLCLLLKMPMGTPDRMYAIEISPSAR
jgi:hypothetical protein